MPEKQICHENLLDVWTLSGDCSSKIVRRGRIGDKFYIDLDFSNVRSKSDEHFVTDTLECTDQAEIYCRADRELRELGFRLPRIFDFERKEQRLLIEDCGGTNLSVIPFGAAFRAKTWQDLIEQLATSYLRYSENGEEGEEGEEDKKYSHLRSRVYDAEAIQREIEEYQVARKLFLDTAPGGGGNVEEEQVKELLLRIDDERLPRADLLERQPKVPCHRDFQTYNVMFWRNRPWVIDIQDACIGPLGYDLASLLRDPKYPLTRERRRELVREYSRLTGLSYTKIRKWIKEAAAVRLIKSAGRQLQLHNARTSTGSSAHLSRVLLALKEFDSL